MFELLSHCLGHSFTRSFSFRDEDMQSLASLMSMKQADIGNLDDFEEENEEDEENRVNQEEKAAKITGEEEEDEGLTLRNTALLYSKTLLMMFVLACSGIGFAFAFFFFVCFERFLHSLRRKKSGFSQPAFEELRDCCSSAVFTFLPRNDLHD